MKSIKIIGFALVLVMSTISCSSDTELSEEEMKAAKEAMKYSQPPYQWNSWPQNTWNNGMPGTKRIQFGKDLSSIRAQGFQQPEALTSEER
jgi:hypothetical protein